MAKKRMALSNGEDKCNFCRVVSNKQHRRVLRRRQLGFYFPKLFLGSLDILISICFSQKAFFAPFFSVNRQSDRSIFPSSNQMTNDSSC